MKNLLILSNFLLIGIIVLMHSCSNSTERNQNRTPMDSSVKNFKGVSLEEFTSDIARYKTTRTDIIENDLKAKGKNFQDARSCWFSLKTLKEYIAIVESSSSKLDISPDSLGIRFYYGVYPQRINPLVNRFDTLNAGRHTLFLVPTYSKGIRNQNIDFDPRVSITPLAETIEKYFGSKLKGVNQPQELILKSTSTSIKNQGQLCPPGCNVKTQNTLTVIDQHMKNVDYNIGD